MLRLVFILFALSSPAFLSACASHTEKASCSQRDWYELGRRDGSRGLPIERFAQYHAECAEDLKPIFETLYNNGRNAGLIEFCDPSNGFDLGRMGIPYQHVCPPIMANDFESAYSRGQHARFEQTISRDVHGAQVDVEDPSTSNTRM